MKSCWQVLGLDQTTDKKEIRKAYSRLVKHYHPEDEPEKYKEIREAYEQALSYVKYAIEDDAVFQKEEFISSINQEETIPSSSDHCIKNHDHMVSVSSLEQCFENTRFLAARETQYLYESGHVNDVEAWDDLFQKCAGREEQILQVLNDNDMKKITNEYVIFYIEKAIKELQIEEQAIYTDTLTKLQAQLKKIRKSIPGHCVYLVLEYFTKFSLIVGLVIGMFCCFLYGFRSFFMSDENTLSDILIFFISGFCASIFYCVNKRNHSTASPFLYRNQKLIDVSISVTITAWMYLYMIFIELNASIFVIIGLLSFTFFMHQDYFEKEYGSIASYMESLCIISILIDTCCVFLALIIFCIDIICGDGGYVDAVIFFYMMLYFMFVVNTLSRDKTFCGVYERLKHVIVIISLVGGICGCNFLIHLIGNPEWENHPVSFIMCFDLLIFSFLSVLFLMRIMKIKRRYNFKALFKLPMDEFIMKYFDFLSIKCVDGNLLSDLNKYERIIYLSLAFHKKLQIDGFEQYFNSPLADHYVDLCTALVSLQANEQVKLLQKATALIFNDTVELDSELRSHIVCEALKIETCRQEASKLLQEYFSIEKDLEQLAYDFVMEHKKYFPYKRFI